MTKEAPSQIKSVDGNIILTIEDVKLLHYVNVILHLTEASRINLPFTRADSQKLVKILNELETNQPTCLDLGNNKSLILKKEEDKIKATFKTAAYSDIEAEFEEDQLKTFAEQIKPPLHS
ncbi:hypothetical protein A2125_02155 [Candidatus Woesebacteria bacterium GWB1_43_5]|uniref:Uncharacterized protein n=1 Tax=Candidatus Woesebacteria bacterium GWB1_43_5 TaxID=1802474 RepID=A0A1F7WU12_9BACT|nr:MAG: hypothetical protein A2125_02155 [Candidatus Woesebacteria bacterium GWB1_43_5]